MHCIRKLFKRKIAENSGSRLVNGAEHLPYLLNQAALAQMASNPKAALAACTKILALDPKNIIAYHLRGFARYDLGDLEGAVEDWSLSHTLSKQTLKEMPEQYRNNFG